MTRIKIDGKWVEVKEGEEIETKPADVKAPKEGEDEGEEGDKGDKSLMEMAKKIAGEAVKEGLKSLDTGETSKLSKKLEKFLEAQYGDQSKLKQILNGKDLYGGAELTKDEKIVGFFHALVTQNEFALKALAEGVSADGGYLFPNEFLAEVTRDLPNINVMRQYVRIIPMKRNKMDISALTEHPKVYWTAENVAKTTTTARFSSNQLVAFKAAAIIYSSDELIEDSTETDLVALIIQLFSEAIADEEELVIWQGNGTTQPSGINGNSSIGSMNGTGDIYKDLTNLYHLLPIKYRANAAWFMSDLTAAAIENARDTQNRPLFNAATESLDMTLKGKPVVVSHAIPARVVFFGDMKRGYFLGDRKSMSAKVSNDTETAFTKDQTAIRVVFRLGGLVVLPQAIKKCTNF